MNDDNTEEPALPVPAESNPIPVDFEFPFVERIRSGLVLKLILAEARKRADSALRNVPDWKGKWHSEAQHEWHLYLKHAKFNTQVVVAVEGKGPSFTILTMQSPAPESFDAALTRAVRGKVSAIPELVKPCIAKFGLKPKKNGYSRTKGRHDDPDNYRYPMRDFIIGFAGKYEVLQQRAISELVGALSKALEPKSKANLVESALKKAAASAAMTTTDGYRVVLNALQSSLLCGNQIVRVTQEYGFSASVPESVDTTCERIHIRWQHDPSGYAHLVATFLVYRIAANVARIEVDVPGVDSLTPLVVRTIEEIREVLGVLEFSAVVLRDEEVLSPTVDPVVAMAEDGRQAVPTLANRVKLGRDNAHFAHDFEKRRKIVLEYRSARAKREVKTVENWAQTKYHISANALRRYLKEFPDAGGNE